MTTNSGTPERLVAHLQQAISRHAPVRQEPLRGERLAAVVLLLRDINEMGPEMLLIKRAEYRGDPWSGHVALPGGRMEPGDTSLERTAVRETFEEISVDIDVAGTIVGALDDVAPRTPRLPPLIIRPFVAILGDDVSLKLSDEVAAAFWVPLAEIFSADVYRTGNVVASSETLEVKGYALGEHFVWGLTERILTQFAVVVRDG